MKNGHYWVRFSPKMNDWVMMYVANGYMYKATPSGLFDFGRIDEFMDRYPGIEIVEIEEPKRELQLSVVVLRNSGFPTCVGRIEVESNVEYAVIDESEKENFLDSVAQYYRNRAEELLFERRSRGVDL